METVSSETRPMGSFGGVSQQLLRILSPVIAVAIALSLGGVLMLLIGINPLEAYWAIVQGSVGSRFALSETVVKAIPLLIAGLAVVVAYRAEVWNIGAEGQLLAGAIGATAAGIFLPDMPPAVHLPITIAAGFVAGALWGAIPGMLKVVWGLNEVIVTLMLNYVIFEIVSFLVNGPWKDPLAVEPYTRSIASSAILPRILDQGRIHAGFWIAIALTVLVHIFLYRSVLGYELRTTGLSAKAARYAGINVKLIIVLSMVISGGIAGLAGMSEVAGLHHRLLLHISPGYGYTAIVVALLGRLTPLGTALAAFLFAALVVGADSMQRSVGAPSALVLVVQGLVILSVPAVDHFLKNN